MTAILLVKTSSLGDVVHNLPVVSDIHARFPRARVDWVVEESFAELPRLHPGVTHIIKVAIRRWRRQLFRSATWREISAFRQQLRSCQYDYVVDTQGLLKSAWITWQAHGLRCGYCAEAAREPIAARFYDREFAIPRNLHAVERNRWLVAAALEYPPDLPLRYGIAAQSPSRGNPYCVLLTATSRADKNWPDVQWLALAQLLNLQGYDCVLPAGSPVERARAERLVQNMRRAQCAPPSNLSQLADLLAGAAGIVGVDTGLTHLAAALDRPTVAVFGATDPMLTGVHAGARAVNLGRLGQLPDAQEVAAMLFDLMEAAGSAVQVET
ncbi:MAG: lipopolysaccharide heptosyltransferase I [Rhodocyclaceae bacterium]|nr:lipopolysaccharide heptosyltransferase I [Rhodocyclaceae bacterium]MBX3669147.1 lipopolysaccharide heptosyltransferase I [Rhodocyclaceae bacterium]